MLFLLYIYNAKYSIMYNFNKTGNVRSSLNIGLREKRVFKNLQEVKEWMLNFPDVYTGGRATKYRDLFPIFGDRLIKYDYYTRFVWDNFPSDLPHSYLFNIRIGDTDHHPSKLVLVKWMKENLLLEYEYGTDRIWLKDAKWVADEMQEEVRKWFFENN